MNGSERLRMTGLIRLRNALAKAVSVGLAALREIFDESAYARFLARSHATSSPESYSAFLQEQAESRNRRPRCC